MCDFERNIWCLLGLTFDAIDLNQACESVRRLVDNRSPSTISTPNLNFLISSHQDAAFRDSVIDSELSTADGMPLIWVARLLNLPLPERVPGSGLVEKLRRTRPTAEEPIKVFFFGGEAGIAERACRAVNRDGRGLSCSGFHFPGYSSVPEMSNPDVLEQINRSGADFVIVAIGAKKGQQWIERNRDALSAPILGYLGAVVNFIAGNVRRAPQWMQTIGFEWLWRIVQEPALWTRYLSDGMAFIKLLVTRVIPYAWWQVRNRKRSRNATPVSAEVNNTQDLVTVTIQGDCLHGTIGPLRRVFRECSTMQKSVRIELDDVKVIDGAFVGLCMLLWNQQRKVEKSFALSGVNNDLRRILRWNCAEFLN